MEKWKSQLKVGDPVVFVQYGSGNVLPTVLRGKIVFGKVKSSMDLSIASLPGAPKDSPWQVTGPFIGVRVLVDGGVSPILVNSTDLFKTYGSAARFALRWGKRTLKDCAKRKREIIRVLSDVEWRANQISGGIHKLEESLGER